MSKYEPLEAFLKTQRSKEVPMTFEKVEKVLGAKLPSSAYRHRPWWANESAGHVHAKAWLEAGYETAQVDMGGKKLVFRRSAHGEPPMHSYTGMAEHNRTYEHDDYVIPSTISNAPLIGAMKGTFTIEPGYDLTSPMYTGEEWAEIEKAWEEKWDNLLQGMPSIKSPKK